MPATRTAAQQPASCANGPTTAAGKADSAPNGTRHGPFPLLPSADRDEFAKLHVAVTADWGPRDAYERRWVMELATSMWRQDRLRGLELATLTAAAAESPTSEATIKKLATFARYGARIDKDIGRALQALRVLRNRPDAWIDELQDGTYEPGELEPQQQNRANDLPACTFEPKLQEPHDAECTIEFALRALEPGRANANLASDTPEPDPAPALSRQQLEALAHKRRHAA